MKDVTLNQIIEEIHEEFPTKVPKFIIRHILWGALKKLYRELQRPDREFRFHYCDIVKIYEVTDGKEVLGKALDLDETTVKPEKDIAPIYRLPYYNIMVHTTKSGEKKKKIIGYRGNRKRKSI